MSKRSPVFMFENTSNKWKEKQLYSMYCLFGVTIDIALSSYQNARKLHTEKKAAQQKQQKTISASSKALKSAKMKTKEALEVVVFAFL